MGVRLHDGQPGVRIYLTEGNRFPVRLEGECRLPPSRTRLFAPVRLGFALVVEATLVDAWTRVIAATLIDA